LGNDAAALAAAARGITTTDKFEKIASRAVTIQGRSVQVTGLAKGAGMIGPNMATMLCVIMTDAALSPANAQQILATAADHTFNCMSVEGHMSTSDTLLLIASGGAGVRIEQAADRAAVQQAVTDVAGELARMIPADGEGCATREDARQIAKAVANSALVKTGIAGADPNWGRVVSAAGYCGVPFDPDKLTLSINGTLVYRQGMPVAFNAAEVSASIRDTFETLLVLTLGEGDAGIRFWTSDLTADYVRFNSQYTT
jgi:glutamate N-acetyltransferase/amino-acid N-acetyltransferase